MPLSTDLRPKDFSEFIGNQTMIESLKSELQKDDRSHCYLFHGHHGCGKTTLAYIIAKKLGCDQSSIIKINSSNNTGVDTARKIIEDCIFAPLVGEVKVYILDEVHNTSKQFQDALLDVTEPPPDHVYFIMCTTELKKIQPALQDRFAPFKVEKPPKNELSQYLMQVCIDNKIDLKKVVIDTIIQQKNGVVRGSLVMLDQVSGLSEKPLEDILNFIRNEQTEDKEIIDICRALTNLNMTWDKLRVLLKDVNAEPEGIRRAAMGWSQAVLLGDKSTTEVRKRACIIIEYLKAPFYDCGKPGLVSACFKILSHGK